MVPGGQGSLPQCFGSLPSQQSEVQRLKEDNELLVARFQNAKAMEKPYYDNWIGTFPQLKNLKTENEELKKTLKDARQANGVLEDENENLKTKFSFPSKRALPKATLSVPTVTTETSSSVMPVKSTNSSKEVNRFLSYGRHRIPALASADLKSVRISEKQFW